MIPKWETLNLLNNNRAIKSSAIWLVLTPILAKCLEKVKSLELPYVDGLINLSLPFSWICLFFAALFFSISSIIFQIYCPTAIKSYKNLMDYREKDSNKPHMKKLFQEGLPPRHLGIEKNKIEDFFFDQWYETTTDEDIRPNPTFDTIFRHGDTAYTSLRIIFNETRTIPRLIITALFFIGASFLVLILAQNILYVLNQI